MNVRFVVIAPESKKGTFTVKLPIVVGRSEEAKFRIQQDRVSRKHCEFFGQDGVVYLRDLGSTNGTFLEDEQVPASEKTPMKSGAVVRVGGLAFRVEYDMPPRTETTDVRGAKGKSLDDTIGAQYGGDPEPLHVEHTSDSHASAVATHADSAQEPVFQEAAAEEAAPDQVAPKEVAAAAAEPAPAEQASEKPKKKGKGFDFLAAAPPAENASAHAVQWPTSDADAGEAPPEDEKLGDFFKGLK
jgi:predicted component of type VI protein secretion system